MPAAVVPHQAVWRLPVGDTRPRRIRRSSWPSSPQSPTTRSSATCRPRRWWRATATSIGSAPRASTHRACSRPCSTLTGAAASIAPEGDGYLTRHGYLGDTAVLVTRFMVEESTGSVIDSCRSRTRGGPGSATIVRVVRGVRGRTRFRMSCAPRFDYGRASHAVEVTPCGGGVRVGWHPPRPPRRGTPRTGRRRRGGVVRGRGGPGRRSRPGHGRDGPRRVEEVEELAALEGTVGSGARGWRARPTGGGGARWSTGPPSP